MDKITVVLIGGAEERTWDTDTLGASERFEVKAAFDGAAAALKEIVFLSPELILLDIDTERGDIIAVIRNLLARSPRSALFCVSRAWNETKQADYLNAGANYCLARPFTGEELQKALAGEEEAAPSLNGEVTAFFSSKGKSGRTTFIANLAMALERRTGKEVAIIDADVEFGDMAVFFNLEPETTIVEAARDIKNLSPLTLGTYFTKVSDHVKVLCAPRRPELSERVRAPQLEQLIQMARSMYSYVLIDLPQGFNPISVTAAEAADWVCVVVMISGAYELTHLQRSLDVLRSLDDYENRVSVVFTRVADTSEQARREMAEKIGCPVTGLLPNAYLLVSAAANDGRVATDIKPDSELARSIENLLQRHLDKNRERGAS